MATKIRTKNLKDSEIEWIGKIPRDWSTQRLKNVCNINANTLPETISPDRVIRYLDIGDVAANGKQNEPTEYRFKDAPSRARRIVQDDSVAVATVRTYLKAITYFHKPENLIVSTGFAVLDPNKSISGKYLYYLASAEPFIQDVVRHSTGVSYPAIAPTDLGKLLTVVPPLKDQQILVGLLDTKISTIDHAIEQKYKLIDLLKEKRTAIINHAVTRGLDENVELVDSGVEWIGKVPKGWSVTRLKYVGNKPMQYGANEAVTEFEINSDQPRFIRITDINEDGDLRKDTFVSLPEDVAKNYILHEGDLLLARSGATVGKTFKYKNEWGRCCFAGYLIRLSVDRKKADVDFIDYIFKSVYYSSWVSSIFIQATIQNVSAEKYKEFIVFLPSLQEQKRIIAHLNQVTGNINSAVRLVLQSIELLSEYRTSLISQVVTGKVEVTS
jgi:restriction endonuclease S subunit